MGIKQTSEDNQRWFAGKSLNLLWWFSQTSMARPRELARIRPPKNRHVPGLSERRSGHFLGVPNSSKTPCEPRHISASVIQLMLRESSVNGAVHRTYKSLVGGFFGPPRPEKDETESQLGWWHSNPIWKGTFKKWQPVTTNQISDVNPTSMDMNWHYWSHGIATTTCLNHYQIASDRGKS